MIRLLSILLLLSAWAAEGATWLMPTNTAVPNTSPGDTVIVTNGVWTNGITFNNANSGITVNFLAGTVFNSPCWPWHDSGDSVYSNPSGAIKLQYPSNIVLHCNGCIISNSACGTMFTNKLTTGLSGIGLNIFIDGLNCTNMYQHTPYSDDDACSSCAGGTIMDLTGSMVTVSNCAVAWSTAGIGINPGSGINDGSTTNNGGNNTIVNNSIQYCVHSFIVGCKATNCISSNVNIYGNYIDNQFPWDGEGGGGQYHIDAGYYVDGGTSDTNTVRFLNCSVDHNIYGPNFMATWTNGTPFTNIQMLTSGILQTNVETYQHSQTGVNAMYLGAHTWAEIQGFWFHNNVILSHGDTYTNGVAWGWANPISVCGSNSGAFYNTCYSVDPTTNASGATGGISISGPSSWMYGNILFPGEGGGIANVVDASKIGDGTSSCSNRWYVATNNLTGIYSDFNVWTTNTTPDGYVSQFGFSIGYSYSSTANFYTSGGFAGLAGWQNFNGCGALFAAHCDPHSTTNNSVFTSGTWIPSASDTAARAKGTNLTIFASTFNVPRLTLDFNNNPRPSSGNWTIGAFEVNTNAAAAATTYFLPIRNF